MAICKACGQEMNGHVACTLPDFNGRARIPYAAKSRRNCHDCATPPGGLHHPGCDLEVCPDCGGQSISCDCGLDEGIRHKMG